MQYLYVGHRRLEVSKLDFLCTLITHFKRYHILSLLRTFFTIIILYFKHLLHWQSRGKSLSYDLSNCESLRRPREQFIYSSIYFFLCEQCNSLWTFKRKKKNRDNNTFCGNENSMHRVIRMQFGHGFSHISVYMYFFFSLTIFYNRLILNIP